MIHLCEDQVIPHFVGHWVQKIQLLYGHQKLIFVKRYKVTLVQTTDVKEKQGAVGTAVTFILE